MNYLIMSIRVTFALLIMVVSISCMNTTEPSATPGEDIKATTNEIKYLPLGDSYTIGTGASEGNAWPDLLTKHMSDSGFNFTMVDNPARNGYTCVDLIRSELPVFFRTKPDFVTICIGTNDWVQGYDSATFAKNLKYILDTVQAALKVKTNIVLLTVPDFSLTRTGAYYSNGRDIAAGLQSFNGIIKAEAAARGLKCVDIFAISQEVKNDPSLISDDDLHPSDKGYAAWERNIFTVVKDVLR
jgi:lysophospholipase L1-like esterase